MSESKLCPIPGCGAEMAAHETQYPNGHSREYRCPHGDESSPYHQLARRVAELESQSAKTCAWNLDDFDGSWDASCGLKWLLDETSNLAYHEMNFCPKCGCKIEEVPYVQPNL